MNVINYKYYTNLEIELKNNINRLNIELYKLKQEFDDKYNKIENEHINLKKMFQYYHLYQ